MRIVWQAAEKFAADDGWAIASYIGLTLLTSLFPFLIFVAAVAGFLGSASSRTRRRSSSSPNGPMWWLARSQARSSGY